MAKEGKYLTIINGIETPEGYKREYEVFTEEKLKELYEQILRREVVNYKDGNCHIDILFEEDLETLKVVKLKTVFRDISVFPYLLYLDLKIDPDGAKLGYRKYGLKGGELYVYADTTTNPRLIKKQLPEDITKKIEIVASITRHRIKEELLYVALLKKGLYVFKKEEKDTTLVDYLAGDKTIEQGVEEKVKKIEKELQIKYIGRV